MLASQTLLESHVANLERTMQGALKPRLMGELCSLEGQLETSWDALWYWKWHKGTYTWAAERLHLRGIKFLGS